MGLEHSGSVSLESSAPCCQNALSQMKLEKFFHCSQSFQPLHPLQEIPFSVSCTTTLSASTQEQYSFVLLPSCSWPCVQLHLSTSNALRLISVKKKKLKLFKKENARFDCQQKVFIVQWNQFALLTVLQFNCNCQTYFVLKMYDQNKKNLKDLIFYRLRSGESSFCLGLLNV